MIETALSLVREYIDARLEKPNPDADYALYVVFQASMLGSFKCAIAATLQFGLLFDLTFDAWERRWYMNVYKKTDSRELDAPEVPHAVPEQPDP